MIIDHDKVILILKIKEEGVLSKYVPIISLSLLTQQSVNQLSV